MKKGASTVLIAAAAAVMTAAYHTPAPNQGKEPDTESAPARAILAAPKQTAPGAEESPCKAYRDAPGSVADSSSYGDALKVWKKFSHHDLTETQPDITYVIALAPDPIHTNLSLHFDRTMEAIQAAAQDETYVYDSSWLPWKEDADTKTFAVRADEVSEEAAVESREGCPGIILFRKRREEGANETYSHGLAVFVVADEPTQGINEDEWNEAIRVIGEEEGAPKTLHVLGPSFSGSLPSLSRLLAPGSMFRQEGFKSATIYSGSVSSCGAITHFIKTSVEPWESGDASGKNPEPHVTFATFSENSEMLIFRLMSYFRSKNQSLTDVGILSEDETAYGQSDAEPHRQNPPASAATPDEGNAAQPSNEHPCAHDYGTTNVPVWLFYPRDISAVRAAYMEQSIFSRSRQEGGANPNLRRVLRPTAPTVSSAETDTITHYSQDEVPIDEEARLYELVSFLRSHHTHYLLIRGTNPEDLLFLTRFFHHSYPEGRIILLHSDELLRREIDTSEFRGVMLLTNYPLLPREQHWSRLIGHPLNGAIDRHVHRIFPGDTIEGAYLAARFLFDAANPQIELKSFDEIRAGYKKSQPLKSDAETDRALAELGISPGPLYSDRFKENLPDYADPIWLHADGLSKDSTLCFVLPFCYLLDDKYTAPPTWLVTVGRDGNWPIAVLPTSEENASDKNSPKSESGTGKAQNAASKEPPPSTITKLRLTTAGSSAGKAVYYWSGNAHSAPIPWRIALLAIVGFALFHAWALWSGLNPRRVLKTVGLREILLLFRPTPHWRAELLLGTATGIVFCAASVLLFGPLRNQTVWDLNYGESSLYWLTTVLCLLLVSVAVMLSLNRRHRAVALPAFCVLIAGWGAIVFFFTSQDARVDAFSFLYRSTHLTNGVSPLLPLLLILAGLYFSSMLGLREIDLLTSAPVRLPRSAAKGDDTDESPKSAEDCAVSGKASQPASKTTAVDKGRSGSIPKQYSRISVQFGSQIAACVIPFSGRPSIWVPPLVVALAALWLFRDEGGTLTLEGRYYSYTLLYCLMLVGVVAMNHALNLHRGWGAMKLMLRALGREPLRRTFAATRSSPDSSIWALGSGARGEQMRALSNEVESLTHLRNLLQLQPAAQGDVPSPSWAGYAIEQARCRAEDLKESYVTDAPPDDVERHRRDFCCWLGSAVEDVYNWILIPAWNGEKDSLNMNAEAPAPSKDEESKDSTDAKDASHLSSDPVVRAAEEFVCQIYVAYIKKTLSCMRSSAKSVAILFLSLGASISCYPILSRTTVVFVLLVIVAAVFILVARVYMEMARDEILSLMTGTKPGELGSEFWIKILAFGAGPLAGLIAALFPSIAETIFSVLGPSLDVVK